MILRFFLFTPISLLFIYLISFLANIRIGEIEARVFGHFVLAPETYLSERDAGIVVNNAKNIDLFYINGEIPNVVIQNSWNSEFKFGPKFILEPTFHFLIRYFPNNQHLVDFRHWKNYRYWQTFDVNQIFPKTKTHIKIDQNEYDHCSEDLEHFGIPSNKKIVCFFSRSGDYYQDDSPRNSSINLQLEAIKFLVKKGFACVRVGNVVSEKINENIEGVFDYSNSNIVSDLMDIYLLARCEYMISTCSGIDSAAQALRKKCLYVNYLEWGAIDCYKNYQVPLFIPKLFRWKSSGDLLSMSEIVNFGVNELSFKKQFDRLGVEVVDNTGEEILDAVKEFNLIMQGSNEQSLESSILQRKFWSAFGKNAPIELETASRVGSKFLEKYKEQLLG